MGYVLKLEGIGDLDLDPYTFLLLHTQLRVMPRRAQACRSVATSTLLLYNMPLLGNTNIIHVTKYAASAKHAGLLLRPYCC